MSKKLTDNECKFKLKGRPIRILEYAGTTNSNKTLFICDICSNEWYSSFNKIHSSNRGCPSCNKIRNKNLKSLSEQECHTRLKDRNIKMTYYAKLVNNKNSEFLCLICTHKWTTSLSSVHNLGSGCPKCAGVAALSKEDCAKRIKNRPIELIYYVGRTNSNKSKFKCNHCSHEWEASFNNIDQGDGCPKCSKTRKLTSGEWDKRLSGRPLKMIKYSGNVSSKSTFKCTLCSNIWDATLHNVGHLKQGCPKCVNKFRLSECECSNRLIDRPLKIVKYGGKVDSKSIFKCNVCSNTWSSCYSNVVAGSGCPNCAKKGFDATKPAWLYVLLLSTVIGSCYGFGVTKDIKTRMQSHRKNLTGMIDEVYPPIYFDNGGSAKDLESEWKKSPYIVNINIEGFKTECVLVNSETTKMIFTNKQI